jgi:type IV pilus assembly protein PilO
MNPLVERIMKVPTPHKLAAVVGLVAVVTGLNWLLGIRSLDDQIAANRVQVKKLEDELIDKKVIADNLNQFRREKEVLERRLAEALTELPQTRDIDELLRQLNDVGRKSGLEILSLEPGEEIPQTFYASIPIKMEVSGSYHEIAVFFESISKLRRIINVSQLSFKSPTRKSEKVLVKASYLATTFRFLDPKEQATAGKKGKAGKRPAGKGGGE